MYDGKVWLEEESIDSHEEKLSALLSLEVIMTWMIFQFPLRQPFFFFLMSPGLCHCIKFLILPIWLSTIQTFYSSTRGFTNKVKIIRHVNLVRILQCSSKLHGALNPEQNTDTCQVYISVSRGDNSPPPARGRLAMFEDVFNCHQRL